VYYVFDSIVAYDPATVSIAKSANFQVYAIDDTANATPLATTDLGGLPVTVRSNSDGMLTVFRVEDHAQVKLVSGSFSMPVTSLTGVLDDVAASRAASEVAASAAQTAAGAAAESATLAQTRGLPSGGLPGQAVIKDGVDNYEALWADVPLLMGGGPLRFWPAGSTLPPAGSGQQPGDVIFKLGGA